MERTTYNIENRQNEKVESEGSNVRPWVAIIVISSLVLICAILALVFQGKSMDALKDLVDKSVAEEQTPAVGKIILQMIPFIACLGLLMIMGLVGFIVNIINGAKANDRTNFGPAIAVKLTYILSAVAGLVGFGIVWIFTGLKIPKLIKTIKEASGGKEEIANTIKAGIDGVNNLARIACIIIIVVAAIQVIYAILQIVFKDSKNTKRG